MVTIGSFAFPPRTTVVDVRTEEIEDRTRKVVRIRALLEGHASAAALEAALATLESAIDALDRGAATLSLHLGRFFSGRRRSYERYVDPRSGLAAVALEVWTADRYERSTEHIERDWQTGQSGDSLVVANEGNALARPAFLVTAAGNVIGPTIGDGVRSLTYAGELAPGQMLAFDAETHSATLDGSTNVLADCAGDFPLLGPGETTLVYTDDPASAHQCLVVVRYRHTWL